MPLDNNQTVAAPIEKRSRVAAFLDNDIVYSFLHSRITITAAVVTVVIVLAAVLAPVLSPQDPYDLRQLSLIDSHNPPAWLEGGDARFLLGSDDQGRDVFSAILYGSRQSIAIGVMATMLAAFIGISRGLFGEQRNENVVFWVMVLAIGLGFWVQYARTVRGSTMVEKNKDYVLAARLIGIRPVKILFRHVLPNVVGPVLVIATINLALAIITEATLSFLGLGLPSTQPSLGTLIQIGQKYLFAGEWWIAIFPGVTLAALVLAVNLLGDWLRDALNPRLR